MFSPRLLLDRGLTAAFSPARYLFRGPSQSRFAALTFEFGPYPEHTPTILKVLNFHGTPATFFISGEAAVAHSALVEQISAAGHVIGHCGYYQDGSSTVSDDEFNEELIMSEYRIREITGTTPRLFRPDRRKLTLSNLRRLWQRGQTAVCWSYDPHDRHSRSAHDLLTRFSSQPVQNGDIIRLHDDNAQTATALSKIISGARQCGIDFGTPLAWLD